MPKFIDEIEFTIFDTETTGLDPFSGDRIVEIAAIRIKGDDQIAVFDSLINPGRDITPQAFQVNGITREMLSSAPAPGKVLPRFMDFAKNSCLCSYNAAFDLDFLNNELKCLKIGDSKELSAIDILRISRSSLPGLPRYPLWFVAENLGIKAAQEHRALADVEMTLRVFYKLKDILRKKNIIDFEEFLALFQVKRGI